ncbi:hypothetical protein ACIBCT_05820 [Streptosporangium sp. NPDC050855]|uniref:hypothetical protein n=1 Tax=Streptosporangium sp. NPDC050855 TaxID=3366194 RepID=UPI00379CC699
MTDTIDTGGSTRLSSRACGHSHCERHATCIGAGPFREYHGPLEQIRPDEETSEREGRLAAAERKATDQTAFATYALSLQQKERRRAESLATTNQRLRDAHRVLEQELATAREEAVAARIRAHQLDYQAVALRERYVNELRQFHQEAAEQARALRAEVTIARREIDDLRVVLLEVREQAHAASERTRVAGEPPWTMDEPAWTAHEPGWTADEPPRVTRARVTRTRVPRTQVPRTWIPRTWIPQARIARVRVPVARGRSGMAASPRGRHRKSAPRHRARGRGLWPVSRPAGLSWMRTRPAGVLDAMLTSIMTWLARIR